MCGNHECNPGGGAGGSWDQIWSSGALLGPLRPPKGPKLALLGPQGAQKRADTRPKCVVTMCPIALDQSAAVGTKSGSGGPKKAFWGPNEPFFGAPGVPYRSVKGPKCMIWIKSSDLIWFQAFETIFEHLRHFLPVS